MKRGPLIGTRSLLSCSSSASSTSLHSVFWDHIILNPFYPNTL